MSRSAARRPRGFTLIEILVVVTLMAVLGAGMTKLVISQSRFASRQYQSRVARGVARDAYNILMTDLRMVQDSGGVTYAASDSIKVRVPLAFGVVCWVNGATYTTVSLVPTDSAWFNMGTYRGVAYRDSAGGIFAFDTVNTGGTIAAETASPTPCVTAGVSSITYGGRTGATVRVKSFGNPPVGTPMFVWQEILYYFAPSARYPGVGRGLFRKVTSSGVTDEIIAPFDTSARFKFYVLNRDTSQVSVPNPISTIRGLDIVLNALSPQTPEGESRQRLTRVTTAVFFKDRRDQ